MPSRSARDDGLDLAALVRAAEQRLRRRGSVSRRAVRTPKLSVPSASSMPRASARRSATGRRASAIRVQRSATAAGRPPRATAPASGPSASSGAPGSRQEPRQHRVLEAGQTADDAVDDERIAAVAGEQLRRVIDADGGGQRGDRHRQLPAHPRRAIAGQRPHRGLHRVACLGQPWLGDAHGGRTDLRRRVAQARAAPSPASRAPRPSSVHERVQPRARIAARRRPARQAPARPRRRRARRAAAAPCRATSRSDARAPATRSAADLPRAPAAPRVGSSRARRDRCGPARSARPDRGRGSGSSGTPTGTARAGSRRDTCRRRRACRRPPTAG